MSEVDRIESVLIMHGTVPGLKCHCGHQYRPGQSIARHRATAVSIALTLHDAGVKDDDLVEATAASLNLMRDYP
ncbi:hypothetical protein [Curtobacterium sp. MCLR17_042]|uniref:hypothetical protein n=1 Tax=Curtobacterium sp. MCLR17_042 TaxID=2175626 RepID=UPI000DA7698E|nr:hypothetical protein [Curtobacterium sp. MCLR17_042]PZE31785.1 hypothetical protein DEJ02_00560 [Curtobacterium sp. MCLR17_042]